MNKGNDEDGHGKKKKKKQKQQKTNEGAMEVVVMGLSHHNAAVDVREKLAIAEVDWNAAAAEIMKGGYRAEDLQVSLMCSRREKEKPLRAESPR